MISPRFFIVLFCLTALTASTKAFAQRTDLDILKSNVMAQARKLGQAFVMKDYESTIRYMHPKLVEAMGGSKKLVELFKNGLPGGAEIKDVELSNPSDTILHHGEIQCTLIQTLKVKTKSGLVKTTSTLVAVSPDSGTTWYFIDATRPFEELKRFFPNLSDRLQIRPQSQPISIEQ